MPSPAELVTTDVDRAARLLVDGGLVAFPTETVYGLAADAEQPAAVERIFEVKGRPGDHPLIVHLADAEQLHDGWAGPLPPGTAEAARLLADASWPGPLTILVPRGRRVSDVVTGGRPTVGLRVPAHPVGRALLQRFGGGLAAPSANRFGKVSPTTAGHVVDDLAALLDPNRDAVLDGGPSSVGVESTIVDLTTWPVQVLRAGAITRTDVERILSAEVADASGPSRASGMLAAHYAPECEVVLADNGEQAAQIAEQLSRDGLRTTVLDRTEDLVVAARQLYADLRQADAERLDAIVVVLPGATGLGHALRDRLVKAAAGSRRDRPNRAG